MEQIIMSPIEQIIHDMKNYGEPIFAEIFKLNDADLKEKLQSIVGEKLEKGFFEGTRVKRLIINESPDEIKIEFYSVLRINSGGIHFKPEHGQEIKLVNFNQHFKL